MATKHIVKQGDHLSRIAAQYGFKDYHPIWNHASNSDLRNLRKSPNILLPGDVVSIPDKKIKKEAVRAGQAYWFRLSTPPLNLRIAVKDFDNELVINENCELEVEGTVFKVKSNGQGVVEHTVPCTAENGKLRIPRLGIEIPLKIGHLDPLDEGSGWKARLINLGYYAGEEGDLQLRYAIEEFQCDHKVQITGEFDAATQAKLKVVLLTPPDSSPDLTTVSGPRGRASALLVGKMRQRAHKDLENLRGCQSLLTPISEPLRSCGMNACRPVILLYDGGPVSA